MLKRRLSGPFLATTGPREIVLTGSRQLVEQGLGILEVGGVEALGEPSVDRRKQVVRLLPLALLSPQVGEAGGGAQFKRFRTLLRGSRDSPREAGLDVRNRRPCDLKQLAVVAVELARPHVLVIAGGQRFRLRNDVQPCLGPG